MGDNGTKMFSGYSCLALLASSLLVSGCAARPDCKLQFGGAGYYANYPADLDAESIPDEAEFFAFVEVSRATKGSLMDYQEKLIHVRVWPRGEEDILDECVSIKSGKFDIEFEWEEPEELSLVIDYEDVDERPARLVKKYHLGR